MTRYARMVAILSFLALALWATIIVLGLLVAGGGCGPSMDSIQVEYQDDVAECLRRENAIVARVQTTEAEDEIALADERARCDAELRDVRARCGRRCR